MLTFGYVVFYIVLVKVSQSLRTLWAAMLLTATLVGIMLAPLPVAWFVKKLSVAQLAIPDETLWALLSLIIFIIFMTATAVSMLLGFRHLKFDIPDKWDNLGGVLVGLATAYIIVGFTLSIFNGGKIHQQSNEPNWLKSPARFIQGVYQVGGTAYRPFYKMMSPGWGIRAIPTQIYSRTNEAGVYSVIKNPRPSVSG